MDYGARMYDGALGKFFTQDRFAEKYYPLSPYQYGANNPIRNVDVNGDSIWVTQNGDELTLHATMKLINRSSDNVDMVRALQAITDGITETFSGEAEINGFTFNVSTDIKIEVVESVDEIDESDHVMVLANTLTDGFGCARGAAHLGEKNSFVDADDFPDNGAKGYLHYMNTTTARHEFGHMAGLEHQDGTVMMSGASVFNRNLTPKQRGYIISAFNGGNLNQGASVVMGFGKKHI